MAAAPLPETQVDRSAWPAALQTVPLERLSSGALALLDRGGNLVAAPASSPAHEETTAAVTLDLRVAPNLRLGDDPAPLPPTMRAQAEPHIARSQVDPDFIAAVFQEGRFADGGAVDCGYSITHDGGLTWTRALIPNLTMVTGGPYFRATDPIAGIDLEGKIFLCTEGATNSDFSEGIILVSRSTDGGTTFGSPAVVFKPTSSNDFPDKPWMAVNNFSGTSTPAGRIVVTWTLFKPSGASPIQRSYSDDHGLTWSSATAIHSSSLSVQGSQPVFLRDGRLAIIYWNFADSGFGGDDAPATDPPEEIDMVLSNDGGVTFSAPTKVVGVTRYDQPIFRDGVFLPSATTDRTTGNLYLVYQAIDVNGLPRVLFTKSTNSGATWSAPIAASDNPGTGIFNPAISASPDGQTLTVSFYDQRDSGGDLFLCNFYLAQSFDGGATWQPNIRVTSESSLATLAPLTDSGYMLGDYLGIAETTSPDVPAVPVWVDTRTGNPDPFVSRIGIAPNVDFTSFQASRLSLAQINDPQTGGPEGDADADGETNLSEFFSATEPNDPGSVVHTSRQLNISTRENVGTDEKVLIGGFIITGSTSKKVILRAIGPSLSAFGLTGLLQDPILELRDKAGDMLFMNNNWRDTQESDIIATGFQPGDDRESAILATLPPGEYTTIVQGQNNTTGTALVEAYDLDPTPDSEFGNLSTRGFVGLDDQVLIGGLVVSDEESAQANVILRALGPSLGALGVMDPLQDPILELHDVNGTTVAANDNWQETQAGYFVSAGLAPPDDREAAIFASLPAGSYTAIVRGVNATTGIGLIEVYNIP
ncbi:MAG TPA: sialidase family protein [Chthoniobacterales bacterium]|nr:sialidase family protein [Chthoniobacterales bacterium]